MIVVDFSSLLFDFSQSSITADCFSAVSPRVLPYLSMSSLKHGFSLNDFHLIVSGPCFLVDLLFRIVFVAPPPCYPRFSRERAVCYGLLSDPVSSFCVFLHFVSLLIWVFWRRLAFTLFPQRFPNPPSFTAYVFWLVSLLGSDTPFGRTPIPLLAFGPPLRG